MRSSGRKGLLLSSDDDSCYAVAEEKKLCCIHYGLWIHPAQPQQLPRSNMQCQFYPTSSASCFPFHHHLFINAPCNPREDNWDHILCHATHLIQKYVIHIIFFFFYNAFHLFYYTFIFLTIFFYLSLYFRNYCCTY